MKKSIVSHLATFILGGIIFGSVGATLAYSYVASDISYTTSHNSSVENVEQAINDLYTKAQSCYKTYQFSEVIYFDPVNNTSCDTYTSSNSLNQTKTGCLKWYVIKDNGSSIDVILDHNTTYTQKWDSSYTNVAYESSLVKPQIDALVSSSGWNSSLNPRLITAAEINEITEGPSSWNVNDYTTWYYFDSLSQTQVANTTNKSNYAWLYDYTNSCAQYGCNTQDNSSGYGYWASTPVGTTGSGSGVWLVNYNGSLGYYYASYTHYGVRPVVTIQKSNL